MDSVNLRTPLYDAHVALGARMVPFGGWDMPVQYQSGIIAEVHAVRNGAGLFDVSHMGRVYISGPAATEFLDTVVTGSAATLEIGRARYCMICNERGGVIDDTIFYRLAEEQYLLIPNAGNRHRVLDWFGLVIGQQFGDSVTLNDRTMQSSLMACQGPAALGMAGELAEGGLEGLRPFAWTNARMCGADVLVGRTGYTGEDGVEILAPAPAAPSVWNALTDAGAVPCGLAPGTCCAPRPGCRSTAMSWTRPPRRWRRDWTGLWISVRISLGTRRWTSRGWKAASSPWWACRYRAARLPGPPTPCPCWAFLPGRSPAAATRPRLTPVWAWATFFPNTPVREPSSRWTSGVSSRRLLSPPSLTIAVPEQQAPGVATSHQDPPRYLAQGALNPHEPQ